MEVVMERPRVGIYKVYVCDDHDDDVDCRWHYCLID